MKIYLRQLRGLTIYFALNGSHHPAMFTFGWDGELVSDQYPTATELQELKEWEENAGAIGLAEGIGH